MKTTKTKINKKVKKTKHTKHSSRLSNILLSNVKLYKNKNGTRMVIMPQRSETTTASIYFFFKVGSKNEPIKINGISHFIEHMCFKGSPKYPNYLDISKTFDANGISFNAYTSKDVTAYHYSFLSNKENLDLICKITSDMVMNPLMREKDIKTERNVIIQEYNDDIDDIDEYIDDKIESCLFEGHPLSYPIIGTLKTIQTIPRKELVDYHKKYYHPDNLVIGLSGKTDTSFMHIIEKYFGGSGSFSTMDKTEQGTTILTPFIDKNPNAIIDCFKKDLQQDYTHILFKTKGSFDPLCNHYKLLKNILGSNMSSRLFIEIREKLGLVYSIKCDITNYEEIGYFDIYTQNESKDTIKCIVEIFNQLHKLKEHGINEKELIENKKNYCDLYKTNFDDIEYELEHYANQILLNKPLETIKMRIDTIQGLTASQLQNAAQELFNFNKVHIITFGKIKKANIEKNIKQFM